VMMIVWGTLASAPAVSSDRRIGSGLWAAAALGASLALYVFMADSLRALPHGADAVRTVLPPTFNWPVFGLALTLMAVPVVPMVRDAILPSGRRRTRTDARWASAVSLGSRNPPAPS
jgi:hypothetical protein